jgi:hypothetical protein
MKKEEGGAMIHTDRVFGVQYVSTIKTLANQLFQYTWKCCTGYQLGDYLFLNDSLTPYGAQEFAVFRITNLDYIQIESIAVWTSNEEHLKGVLSQSIKSRMNFGTYQLKLEDVLEHRCNLCR